jgi:two-component system, OmpR family, alkaline phosphatase synthesis response regulator PhoP
MLVLIAEDDELTRNGLKEILEGEGYRVVAARDGAEALAMFRQHKPDFICLDIMMPKADGYSVCREIRSEDNRIPIIFLSAKSEEIDRVVGLELGADDYIVKPFGAREVTARIRAVTRRCLAAQADKAKPESFRLGDLDVFPKELRARRGETAIDLSLREVAILEQFYLNPGRVLDRDFLYNKVWGYDHIPNSRTLDQTIAQLRKKIEREPQDPQIIHTVHGAGYRYEEPR